MPDVSQPPGKALVIGGTRGLGAYLAARLAETGWEVTATGKRRSEAVDLPPGVGYLQADLSDTAAVEGFGRALAALAPSLIVHNAVTYGEGANGTTTLAGVEEVFRVNAIAPYLMLQDYLSARPDDGFCSCVVVNSDSIFHANRHNGVYAASKAALRILTASLASSCHSANASVSTLLLGPLADPKKVGELRRIAEQRSLGEAEVIQAFLRRSNPALVIDGLIEFEPCFQSVQYIAGLGKVANGMVCKLDGGSSGSMG